MTFPSLYAFFRDGAFLGLILLLCFMCEKFPLHAQGGKEWDRDMYWFLCLLLLVASLMTMRKVRGDACVCVSGVETDRTICASENLSDRPLDHRHLSRTHAHRASRQTF